MVDPGKIVQALRATLEPSQQKEAEAYLDEIKKIISFCPSLLQIVMSDEVDSPVRQAGAIYLKNTVNRFWKEHAPSEPDEPVPFSLHEQDKAQLRASVIDAMMHSPDPIMQQLKVCLTTMVQNDFPGRWSAELPEKLCQCVSTDNLNLLMGALVAVYTTVKVFQYTKSSERGPIDESMTRILPLLQRRIVQATSGDNSDFSAGVQKIVLKIFFAYTNNFLPPVLESNHQLVLEWTELLTLILRLQLPEHCASVDPDDRPELVWWKAKKWAMHILCSWFEKFGPSDTLAKKEASFGDWYVKAVPGPVLQVVFEWLDKSSRGEYVSPRLLLHMLNYLETAVPYSHTWRFLKPHIHEVIVRVCFPILCHSEEDAELWESDPVEYVKVKFDIFEEIGSPVLSAQNLVHTASEKRREVLDNCMQFCVQLINSDSANPRQRDGAFRIVGAVADLLMKKRQYKKEVERFVCDKVFPQVQAPEGFLRARACWLLQQFASAKFSKQTLHHIAEVVRRSLVDEKELPVRMEAAMALQSLLGDREDFADIAKPHVPQMVHSLLETMRQTSNDDLNSVLQKIFLEYREEIGPLAASIVQQLAETFVQLLKASGDGEGTPAPTDDDEDRAVLAMGILTTLETIASVLEEDSHLMSQLEPIMLSIVQYILSEGIIDYYEEAISLAHSLICERVSPTMWGVLPQLYQCFERDGVDYFSDMMNPLHCYITVDPEAFLADPSRIDIVIRMCSKVLDTGAGEDAEYHAAKLLEVLLLQFPGRVTSLVPQILQPAMSRLTRSIISSELRAMCILVGVAALLHWPELTLQLLSQQGDLFAQFLRQWLSDVDCFLSLHDRKLCVLGLCTLLTLPQDSVPPCVLASLNKFMPSFLMLFEGLKTSYQLKSRRENDSDDEEGEGEASRNGDDSEDEAKELASDEDDVDPEQEAYAERLKKLADGDDDEEDDLDDDDEDDDLLDPPYETALDKDECELDEYATFKATLERLSGSALYNQLMASITQQQSAELQEVLRLADQRAAQRQSKKIGQSGGYSFVQTAVPTAFNFGGSAPPPNFNCSPPGPPS